MYCNKCNKHSPDNFIACAYCGAKFKPSKKKEPRKFDAKKQKNRKLSLKAIIGILIALATVLVIVAIIVALFLGSKPEKVVKQFAKSIEVLDEKLYFSLYDENIVEYKTDNYYFGEEETYNNMITPLKESHDFYLSVCGSELDITYNIKSEKYLTDDELVKFNDLLESNFDYVELPSRVAVLDVEITAEGEQGEYKSVYDEFWCMKIKGNWYLVDKTVLADFDKIKTAS